jgi:hypothetical protein
MDNLKVAVLSRIAWPDHGTFGYLTTPSGTEYATVERPWLNNMPSVSCIPTGIYICKPRFYNRGGYDAIEVTDVEGRTYIMFHIANSPHEVAGCIGINQRLGSIKGQWAGVNSTLAFEAFMSELGNEEFKLSIENRCGGRLAA